MTSGDLSTSTRGERRQELIYVVDDEAMIGEVVEVVLRLEGFQPQFFANPKAAYEAFLAAAPRPKLLLTDFLMSPINGMELIQRCKQHDPDLRTVLYSGNVREDIVQYYPERPDAFISKPFLPKTLIDVIHSVLDGSQS